MITEPEKEIRFTRARQAVPFIIAGGLLCIFNLSLIIGGSLSSPWGAPELQSYWWSMIGTIPLSIFFLRLSWRWLRHAYLIFSPVGIEIFPAFKPEKQLNVISWAEIHHMEIKNMQLFLHFDEQETSGTVLTLAPIHKSKIPHLEKIIAGYRDRKSESEKKTSGETQVGKLNA